MPLAPYLRQGTTEEDGSSVASLSLAYKEHDVLAAFEFSLEAIEVGNITYRLLVNLEDDIPSAQANIVGKRAWLHIGHNDALIRGNLQAVGNVRSNGLDGQSETAFCRLFFIATFFAKRFRS